MPSATSPKSMALSFAAGFLAVVVFHQGLVAALNAMNAVPAGFPAWSLDPVPPLGVPAVISKAFWGGIWGMGLGLLLAGRQGAAYWLGWTLLGAIALPLVAIFVVPPLKGVPIPDFLSRFPLYALVNAAWGLGTAVFLKMFKCCG